jgi:hypothetical protein
MAESYPVRERYWSHRFCRLLTKLAVANEIGAEACWMLTVIAHQEDAKRYRGPVTYYNGQIMPLCAFNYDRQLIRARNRAIAAGWLHYEQGGKSRPGTYWCTIPPQYENVPDGPMDEGTSSGFSPSKNDNGSVNQSAGKTDSREIPLANSSVNAQSMRSQSVNLPTLYPSPSPEEKKEDCPTPGEAPASGRPLDEPTEFIFECVGQGAKSWTLTKSKLSEYLEAYPDLDVRAEIRKSRQWIRDNPTNRKTAKGMPAFLNRWLSRAQNNGGRNAGTRSGKHGPQIGPGQRYDPDAKGGGTF